MRVLYFDCSSGISGNMTLGALLEVTGDEQGFLTELKKLKLDEYEIIIEKKENHGISGTYVDVKLTRNDGKKSSGAENKHEHRHLGDIYELIDKSGLETEVKTLSKEIFLKVARAEAKVHGKTLEQVHFHEVGAVDSIIDIVGTSILINQIKPDEIYASILNEGRGYIECAHGKLSVPVPATTEIFAMNQVIFQQIDVDTELVTPTGAAIIATLTEHYGNMPKMQINKVGYGLGSRETGYPNVLRVYEGVYEEKLYVMETNIDDSTGEELGYTLECLLEAGAKDAFYEPIYMKKNRPAYKLTVICEERQIEDLQEIIFCETTTIGIRYFPVERKVLERKIEVEETELGEIRYKVVKTPGGKEFRYPEYEDVRKIAKKTGKSMREIIR